LHVWRDGGTGSLADALRCIHRDLNETAAADREPRERTGAWGFRAGVTRAAVVASGVAADEIESALLTLSSQ
jgi:hypothetical protein